MNLFKALAFISTTTIVFAIDLRFNDCGSGEIVHFRARNAISDPYRFGPGDEIDLEIKFIPKVSY